MKETDGDGSVINNPAFREINYAIIRYKEIRRKRRDALEGKINFDLTQ